MRTATKINSLENSDLTKISKKISRGQKGIVAPISIGLVGPPNLVKEGLLRVLASYDYRVIDGPPTLAEAEPDFATKVQILIVTDPSSEPELPQAVKALRAESHALRIILLVDTPNHASLFNILETPAHAFLCSEVDCQSLLNTFDVILNGGGVISIGLMSHIISPANVGHTPHLPSETPVQAATPLSRPLSGREVEILRCLTGGASNKLIARHFEIAESTVKIHVKGILRKISAQNRTQAAIWALAHVPPIAVIEPHQAHA